MAEADITVIGEGDVGCGVGVPERPVVIHWSGRTACGHVRMNNEDAFLCLQFDAREVRFLGKIGDARIDREDFLFAVSDGMGGAMAGEFASRITVDKVTELLPDSFRLGASGLSSGFEDVLEELFHRIHDALMYLGSCYEECHGMGATLSLCWFAPGWMYFGHIGDSRIYYLPADGGDIRQISHDHTHVGWLYRKGEINEREARNHPRRNALSKALGAGHQFVDPQVGAVGYAPGDRFLLCTDGLVDGLYNHRLNDLIRHPGEDARHMPPAERLVDAALAQSGKDNTTALVVEVGV